MTLRVRVDAELCAGHGRCYALAPSVFGEDERGHCRLLRETVPPELEAEARAGERNCPEDAIRVERTGAGAAAPRSPGERPW